MNSQALPERKPKNPWLAFALNALPLLGLAGCSAQTNSTTAPFSLVCFGIFLFGLGYLDLGHVLRFFLSLLLPWLLVPVTLVLNPYDFEHHAATMQAITPFIIVLGSACLLTAIDAFRLASIINLRWNKASRPIMLESDFTQLSN